VGGHADQTVSLRPVAVASYREDTAILASGAQAGERIVVAGVHKLTSGERVSVIEQPSRPRPADQRKRATRPAGDDAAQSLRVGAAPPLAGRLPDRRADACGVFSYFKLGRAEDPDFTFKAMVVRTLWPGATAHEVELQVTERIEKRCRKCRGSTCCARRRDPASR
jgi:hypothetical protein